MKERLETGRKFSYYLGQDKVFLTTGFTTDDLKVDGKSTRQQLEIDDVRKSWEEAIDKFKKWRLVEQAIDKFKKKWRWWRIQWTKSRFWFPD